MTIITSGAGQSDIDSLACSIALKELYDLQGTEAKIAINPNLTVSVTPTVIGWGLPEFGFDKYQAQAEDSFILEDFSMPLQVPSFVNLDKITRIFDHHFFSDADFWYKKIGKNAIIEAVGSCASLIWREWKDAGLLEKISQLSAKLLVTAIISNTLNLQAGVTVELDREAYEDLLVRSGLGADWAKTYYAELDAMVAGDPLTAITKDTHSYPFGTEKWIIGQLELWDSEVVVNRYLNELQAFLEQKIANAPEHKTGFLNLPDIKSGKNFIITAQDGIAAEKILKHFGGKLEGRVITTEKLLLRKELWQKLVQS